MNQRNTVKTLVSAVAVIAVGLPLCASAAAPSHMEDVSITVSYKDLNIRTEIGARTLYSRLQRASKKACNVRSLTVTGSVRELAESKRCYREILEAAVQRIDSDALSRIHAS